VSSILSIFPQIFSYTRHADTLLHTLQPLLKLFGGGHEQKKLVCEVWTDGELRNLKVGLETNRMFPGKVSRIDSRRATKWTAKIMYAHLNRNKGTYSNAELWWPHCLPCKFTGGEI